MFIYTFSLSLHFLPVLSLETSVYSTLSVILFFWGHNEYKIIFSINSTGLFIQRLFFQTEKAFG